MSKSIFSKIFSLEDYRQTHKILYIFGIKIKFPKSEYIRKQKNNPFEEYKENNIDITTLPPATGQIRDVQLANLSLLKELDYVCRQHNLKYWLDYGTLLGAIRHKGFIPWDDDIDVGMMREDYNKITDALKESARNSDIYAEQTYLGKAQTIIKIKHRKCPHLFVDIFPRDYTNSVENKENRILKTKHLQKIRKQLNENKNYDSSDKVLQRIKELNSELMPNIFVENSDIQFGLDYSYTEPLWVYPYETIFPLREIEFEGFQAMCINKPEQYLSDIFGDYMAYPKKFGFGHSMYLNFSDEEKEVMKDLIGGLR